MLLYRRVLWCGADLKAPVVFHNPFTFVRVLGLTTHDDVLDLSGAEHGTGMRHQSLFAHEERSTLLADDDPVGFAWDPSWPWSCRLGVGKECYLVDPASSHMLVSKIKPCKSKYKHLYCETAESSLYQL